MTFNPNADVSDNTAQRRGGGRRTGMVVGGGAVGLGAIVVALVAILTNGQVDLSGIVGTGGQTQQQEAAPTVGAIADCKTGADANANDDCRLAASTLSLDKFWAVNMDGYVKPTAVIYEGTTESECGTASNQMGPFYCPPDQGVYIDPSFFEIMRQQFGAGAGDLAQVYVLGHEYGHHVQNLIGIMEQYPNNGTGADSNSVRTELQADCFAGGWIKDLTLTKDKNGEPYFLEPTEAQIKDALDAAAAVGDNNIQSRSGYVNPDTWTHGSSEQRQTWFWTGYQQGINACDTFDGPL